MLARQWVALVALGAMSACITELSQQVPPGEPEDFVRAADILVAAQCELDQAALRSTAAIPFKKVDLTLTLTVQRTEAVGGGITLAIPIASTEVTLRRDRTPRGAALRKIDFRVVHEIGKAGDCPTAEQPKTASGAQYIEGGLGLIEWVREADALMAKSGQMPSELNYLMLFEVAVSSSLAPVFSQPLDDVDSTLTTRDADDREVRHRIVATIVPDTKGKAGDKERALAADRFLIRMVE